MQWLTNAVDITPGATTGWQTVDLTAQGVPANAICILRAVAVSLGYPIGARTFGSIDNRILGFTPAQTSVYVGCDVNKKISLYKSNATTHYWLFGWLTSDEAVYLTTGVDKTPGSTGWQDVNCSATIPAGSKFAIFEVNRTETNGCNFRNNTSTDNRIETAQPQHWWAVVPIDDNRVCEIYQETVAATTIYLVGYIIVGIQKVNGLDISLSAIGSYIDIDLSGDTSIDAQLAVIEVHELATTSQSYDLRKNGLTDEFYTGGEYNSGVYIMALDALRVLEGKIGSTAVNFYVLGYITAPYGSTVSIGDGTFPAMECISGYWATYGDGILPAIDGVATLVTFDIIGEATLPAMTGTGQLEPALGGYSDLPLMDSTGMVLVGEVCSGDLVLPALLCDAELTLAINGIGIADLPALIGTGVLLTGELLTGYAILPGLISTGESAIYSSTTSTAYLILPMLIGEGYMNAIASEQYQVYAMNLKNLGISKYSNFNFNSLCKFQGKYYGINSSGLYLLEGDTDNGAPIMAIVETGKDDMKLRNLKRIEDAFVTMKAKGEYILTLVDKNGAEYSYPIVSRVTTLETYKIDTGKGLRSQLWGLKFKNIAGAKFEVESVELNVVEMKKRHG